MPQDVPLTEQLGNCGLQTRWAEREGAGRTKGGEGSHWHDAGVMETSGIWRLRVRLGLCSADQCFVPPSACGSKVTGSRPTDSRRSRSQAWQDCCGRRRHGLRGQRASCQTEAVSESAGSSASHGRDAWPKWYSPRRSLTFEVRGGLRLAARRPLD